MIDWKPVDWVNMRESKLMVLYSLHGRRITVGYLELDDNDPRGRLCDEDGKTLRFEDYSHYCYVGTPLPQSKESHP